MIYLISSLMARVLLTRHVLEQYTPTQENGFSWVDTHTLSHMDGLFEFTLGTPM